jgi:hypothetical protein
MKNITYGVDSETFYARCGDRVAFFELDYKNMKAENSFEAKYVIGSCPVFQMDISSIRFTKKIPLSIKNQFRKHFKLPELKMKPSYYLVIDIVSGKYLSGVSLSGNSYTSSLSKAKRFLCKSAALICIPPDGQMIVEMK